MALTCPHFGVCGGCSALTTPIAAQRQRKAAAVETALAPYLSNDAQLTWTDDGSTPARHDRLRVLYPVQPHADRGLTAGLFRRGSHEVIELATCELQHAALTEFGQRALRVFRARGLTPYDEHAHRGTVRAVSARLAGGTGELLIGVVSAQFAAGLAA